QFQTVWPALEGTHRARRDPHYIPLLEIDDLVVELDSSRAADDQIDLLLLSMAVADATAVVRAVAEEAEAEVFRVEMRSSKARFHLTAVTRLDLFQVDLREPAQICLRVCQSSPHHRSSRWAFSAWAFSASKTYNHSTASTRAAMTPRSC